MTYKQQPVRWMVSVTNSYVFAPKLVTVQNESPFSKIFIIERLKTR